MRKNHLMLPAASGIGIAKALEVTSSLIARIPQCRQDAESEEPALPVAGDLSDLIGDDGQELWRRELAERFDDLVDQRRDREIACDSNQEQEGRKQREEKVVGELCRHTHAVVFEDGVDERPSEDLSPGKRDVQASEQQGHVTWEQGRGGACRLRPGCGSGGGHRQKPRGPLLTRLLPVPTACWLVPQ